MRWPWRGKRLIHGFGGLLLAVWLIATGLLSLLDIGNPTIGNILALIAVAAGVLLLLNR